jgi:acyl-CoA thioesterase I
MPAGTPARAWGAAEVFTIWTRGFVIPMNRPRFAPRASRRNLAAALAVLAGAGLAGRAWLERARFGSLPASDSGGRSPNAAEPFAEPDDPASANLAASGQITLHTLGDSVLDCRMYNEAGLDPGMLLVRNDDRRFPEFRGQDLSSRGPVRLDHRAVTGATVDDLPRQVEGLQAEAGSVVLLSIGGNDLLRGLLGDPGPGIDEFALALDSVLQTIPVRPVIICTVYDPTFGDDGENFTGVDPVLARANHRRVNEVLAAAAERYGVLADLHAHFLGGDPSWFTQTIEPSLTGASEIRRVALPLLPVM